MSEVMVRDVVLWTKHIHGDPELKARLDGLSPENEVELVVDGIRGHWRKMSDGRDGRPTSGLTPQGRMQGYWRELYRSRRGGSVSINLPAQDQPRLSPLDRGKIERSPQAVVAARAAVLGTSGWSSEGRTFTRDELYER